MKLIISHETAIHQIALATLRREAFPAQNFLSSPAAVAIWTPAMSKIINAIRDTNPSA